MSRLYFGELVKTGTNNMPALEIINEDETGKGKSKYLLPFRCYRFQVTTLSGEGDDGSSTVVGLGNLIGIKPNCPDDTKGFSAFSSSIIEEDFGSEFMYQLAQGAVIEYAKRFINTGYVIDLFGYEAKNKMREFIKQCYLYVDDRTKVYRNTAILATK